MRIRLRRVGHAGPRHEPGAAFCVRGRAIAYIGALVSLREPAAVDCLVRRTNSAGCWVATGLPFTETVSVAHQGRSSRWGVSPSHRGAGARHSMTRGPG